MSGQQVAFEKGRLTVTRDGRHLTWGLQCIRRRSIELCHL
jgi:hypothetical protein